MITSRTKMQLVVFVILTLVGVSFVGARYARLDRLFLDTRYEVTAHFVDGGGIFKGAAVTYRGVGIGEVSEMNLTREGIDVVMLIEDEYDDIPADALAVVGNKSAVGEQYVDLQPRVDEEPYLEDGSEIAVEDTEIPVSTTELLTSLDNLVNSVPRDQLRTVVTEFGTAFKGSGKDLGQIIDTSNSFIETANANFETTTALIRDSNTVLQTQADKSRAIRSFTRDLRLFSGTLAASDRDLRKVINNGSATANELKRFLQQNRVDLGRLIRNLVTTGEIVVRYLDGVEMVLVLYPYIVEGGFSVVGKNSNGRYDANFGLILTAAPEVCNQGYDPSEERPPQDTSDRPMDEDARCTAPPGQTNARGAQNAPRAATSYEAPPVAAYDFDKGTVTWGPQDSGRKVTYTGGAADLWGQDSWKWMLLQPSVGSEG